MTTSGLPLIIVLAMLMHIAWAISLWLDTDVVSFVTGLSILETHLLRGTAAYAIGGSALLACASMLTVHRTLRIMMLLPQQFVLFVSAWGAVIAMLVGHYADGVVRSPLFIFTDQVYLPLIAVIHAVVMVKIVNGKR